MEIGAEANVVDGHGWPEAWEALRARALADGVELVPTISMHDAEAFSLFADPARVERLTAALLSLLRDDRSLAGLHLDVEVFRPVPLSARDGFTALPPNPGILPSSTPHRSRFPPLAPVVGPASASGWAEASRSRSNEATSSRTLEVQ